MTHLVGYVAGLLTTFATVPQVVKSWRSRSVQDLSLPMLVLLSVGLVCWFVYGWLRTDWPVVLANGFTLLLWGSLLWLKIRERRK
jgi:MtN3 and saliva related transmembrane protein